MKRVAPVIVLIGLLSTLGLAGCSNPAEDKPVAEVGEAVETETPAQTSMEAQSGEKLFDIGHWLYGSSVTCIIHLMQRNVAYGSGDY